MVNGLFDVQYRLAKIDRNGDMLVRLNQLVDWKVFLPELQRLREKERKSNAGRPAWDVILMFKMLILKSMYNLSDDALEQMALDRLSFTRFLGLSLGDDVPDAKTVWAFRESLKREDLAEKLFQRFNQFLEQAGFTAKGGQLVDASLVKAPVRRDSPEVNEQVKKGERVEEWTPPVRAQKDIDARWTQKRGVNYYGYKNHIGADAKYKFIRRYEVTSASVHDSQVFESLLCPNSDPSVYADSAYMSAERVKRMSSPDSPWLPCFHEKGHARHPLDEKQRLANRERSRVRVRVEHIFGMQLKRAGNLLLRGIGLARAKTAIGLRNLAYNLERYSLLASRQKGIVS